MAKRQEEIKVGVVVVLAAILFVIVLVFVGGVNFFRKPKAMYTTYFKFAGGLEPGSVVRFGGLKVGTVESAEIDPSDSTRIRLELQVAAGTPVRTDSVARISTLGFLGENYVEVSPGSRAAPLLPAGGEIPSREIVQLADVFNNVNNVTVNANKLVNDLDDKFLVLANNTNQLVNNLNSFFNPQNQQHLEAFIANADEMLAESRPRVKATLTNLQTSSAKLGPTIDKADTTMGRVNALTGNLNKVVVENRQDVRQVLLNLQKSLLSARKLIAEMNAILAGNQENLDETMENVRVSSQNLKEFTDTIKRQPFSLIRIKTQKDRTPPFAGGK